MECPWCPTEAEPRGLHRHLVEVHPEVVALVTQGSQARYELACPICGERLHRAVKPSAQGPRSSRSIESRCSWWLSTCSSTTSW